MTKPIKQRKETTLETRNKTTRCTWCGFCRGAPSTVVKKDMKKRRTPLSVLAAVLLIATTGTLWPQACRAAGSQSQEELAKAAQNPIANMISIPVQINFNFGYGQDRDKSQIVTNLQPVIPIHLNEDWNVITRTIMPITYTEYPAYQTGLGNLQFTGFFSPAKQGTFTWGAGPVFQFPTHTDTFLGGDKWSAGPSAVGLVIKGHWVVGLLAQNIWSYAGSSTTRDNPSVNQFLAQAFINYNLPKGWYLTTSPIITADWKAAGSDQWTVPLGGGFGKIFRAGGLHFNSNLAAYYNVVRPEIGPNWTLRLQLVLLLPE
jgi:hypothetical protein